MLTRRGGPTPSPIDPCEGGTTHWPGTARSGGSSHAGIEQYRRPRALVDTALLQAARACTGSSLAVRVAQAVSGARTGGHGGRYGVP